jgi:hypothetical protein
MHKEVGVIVNRRLGRDAIDIREKSEDAELLEIGSEIGTEHNHDIISKALVS